MRVSMGVVHFPRLELTQHTIALIINLSRPVTLAVARNRYCHGLKQLRLKSILEINIHPINIGSSSITYLSYSLYFDMTLRDLSHLSN